MAITRKQPLATPAEISEAIGIAEKTLANWRSQGKGPRYLKPGGRHVRYDWADVNAWLEEQRPETEDELMALVMAEAGKHGILVHHCKDSRCCWGMPGIPDLILLSFKGILFAELKSRDGDTSADQDLWLCNLHYAGVPYIVWRPQDWEEGTIQQTLNELAAP